MKEENLKKSVFIKAILEIVGESKKGIKYSSISKKLREKKVPFHTKILKDVLKGLVHEGSIYRDQKRYFIGGKSKNILRGEYSAARGGFGFVIPEDGSRDVFIPPGKSKSAMRGDLVDVIFYERENGREGEIVSIVERKYKRIVGYFELERLRAFLIPLDPKIEDEIEIRSLSGISVLPGMLVEGEIKEKKGEIYIERISRVFGFPDDEGVDIEVIKAKYSLKEEFPDKVKKFIENIDKKVVKGKKRIDLREKIIFTIDGEDAKDFDDAVSIEKKGDEYILGVHIADVSHYVKRNSSLDKEAFKRGNSVYFPEKVIPMLPHELSSDLCSLREGVDRYTLSVEMEINKKGNVLNYKVFPSIINSKKRLTYKEAQAIIDEDIKSDKKEIYESLVLMKELAEILIKKRRAKGSLDFDLPEPVLLYKEKSLVEISAAIRLFSHRIIEEFMLIANETIAEFLIQNEVPVLFRIHEEPDPLKLKQLKEILDKLGYKFDPEKGNIPKQLQKIIDKVEGKNEENFVSLLILKSMKLAKYTPINKGHFGLQKENYCHFTSPIRRYPDLIIHRTVKEVLKNKEKKNFYSVEELEEIGAQTSKTERRADEAEKELIRWRIIRFMKRKVGEELYGRITNFTQSAIIVELEEFFVEGSIPYYELSDDYYVPDKERLNITGRRTKKGLSIGDRIKVLIASVDIFRQKIYFLPVDFVKNSKGSKKKGKKRKKKKKEM